MNDSTGTGSSTFGTSHGDAPNDRSGGRAGGVALMLGSGLSNQVGAALGALAFPVIGPVGVVAVRQWVAAVVLWSAGRPRLREFTAQQWWPVAALALVFATMNLSLYAAIDRIGLGLAVTLEFLGPLTVALIGSRRGSDMLGALSVAAAVVVLTRPGPSTDLLGVGLALLAAASWGCYVLLNRTIGQRLPGLEGPAAAAAISAVVYLPIGVIVLWHSPLTVAALAYALAAGILSSAVPFLSDLLALRRVPTALFGVFMSVHPVFAALVGLVVLGQHLPVTAWSAILVIVAVNVLVVTRTGFPRVQAHQAQGPEPAAGGA